MLEFDPELEDERPDDQRTMALLMGVANTVDKNLSFTMDCPSLNSDQAMPILDTAIWVEGLRVRHKFFRKPCATARTIMARSAVSATTKRNSLFQELLRRLSALDFLTTPAQRKETVEDFLNAMRISGYGESLRWDTLFGALQRDEEIRRATHRYRQR